MVQGPDGKWWGVALGVRPQAGNFNHIQLGRETYLFPITWESGWPVFNHNQPLSEHLPGVLKDKVASTPFFTDFSRSHTLDSSFYFIRTPYKAFHSILTHPSRLRLRANAYAPGDRDSAALIVRKQTSYEEVFETELSFVPQVGDHGEAGVSIYYGDSLHNEIGITGDPSVNVSGSGVGTESQGARYIIIRTILQATQVGPWALTTGNNTVITVSYERLATKSGPVKLTIVANATSYSLGYAEGHNGSFTFPSSGVIDSVALSVAPAGGFFFKGAAFGVYNTGNGKPGLEPADFSYWKQTPVSSNYG